MFHSIYITTMNGLMWNIKRDWSDKHCDGACECQMVKGHK